MFFVNSSISRSGHFFDAICHFLLAIPSRVDHSLGGRVQQADLAGSCWQHRWEVHARLVDDLSLAMSEDDLGGFDDFEDNLNSDSSSE